MDSKTIEAKQKDANTNKGRDPKEKKIEEDRINLKIATPSDFSKKEDRDALYRLNKQNAEKNMSATELAEQESKRRGNFFGFRKGGKVKKTGLAMVHKGEKVLTKKEAKTKGRGKMVSCKR